MGPVLSEFLSLKCADLDVVKGRHKVGGDLCRFFFGYVCGTSCSSLTKKTYSSVSPSLAAPRYRNNSTDIAGAARKRVIRIVAR